MPAESNLVEDYVPMTDPTYPIQSDYAAVFVLFLSWKNDDLGVIVEIKQLKAIFENFYGFMTEHFLIPNQGPDNALARKLGDFVQTNQSDHTLLLVYYGGHGRLNDSRLAEWTCHASKGSPVAKWYSHQRLLEESRSDVLLLLDCCHPLGGGGSVRRNTCKQVIGACGFGSEAPGVGQNSFSCALIEELRISWEAPFTVADLHHGILNRLRAPIPGRYGEVRQTPVLSLLGKGGRPGAQVRLVSFAAFPINLIALMGMTGSGKSSLVNRICGKELAPVGSSLLSTTKDVVHYTTVIDRKTVTLIDTPGFDDTYLSDRQVLEMIATYLDAQYLEGRKLTGLLYLRDINLDKMTGSAVKNLDLFIKLVGEDSMKNVVLLTTRWDTAGSVAKAREAEFLQKFWGEMMSFECGPPQRVGEESRPGTRYADPTEDIIKPMLIFEPTLLQIQRELANGVNLGQTTAGEYIDKDLSKKIDNYKQEAASAIAKAHETHKLALKQALSKQAEDIESKRKIAEDERDALEVDFDVVREEQAKRREELVGYGMLRNLDEYIDDLEARDSSVRFVTVAAAAWGLRQAFEFVWKKQGKDRSLIESALNTLG